ncbi:embigin isoform X1 [Corvus kubaryi]|uniref:embigin isoform X1 n=1 Tax=Corvus kubaryi TaxID=68294 RepID=UPI001C05EB0B|nr:embigin isoform X1 [Corvus kubaryi]
MPAAFSGWRLGRLLPLLLCISLLEGSPAGPAMTTQDSSQTQVNSVTKGKAGLNESSGPDVATEELKPAGKEISYDVLEYEIVLPGVSGTALQKIVSVGSPTKVELTCKLEEHSDLKNPQVTWKRRNETISHTSKTQNSWTIQLTVSESSHLGSYSCVLKGEVEVNATFHLQVPKIEGKEKNLITYERDLAVMICKTEYAPMAWTWYMTNGTELVAINPSSDTNKFQIKIQSANVNRLEILKLTKEDSGIYWCEAAFRLGSSKKRFEVKVLSIMAPLKPFIAVVVEVVILVTTIALYEVYSKRRGEEGEREFDQIEQLKSEDDIAGEQK